MKKPESQPKQLTVDVDNLTFKKAEDLKGTKGLKPSGLCLQNPTTGEMVIVNRGAVRWLSPEDAWSIMHPNPSLE